MFQVFTAIHSAIEQKSTRDFSVDVPHRLSNTKSVRDEELPFSASSAFVISRVSYLRLVMPYVCLVVLANPTSSLFPFLID